MKKLTHYFTKSNLLFLFAITTLDAYTQDCDCDITIANTSSYHNFGGNEIPDNNGDGKLVLCIEGGTRTFLQLKGFHGTEGNRVKIRNCGGDVIFDNQTHYYAFSIIDAEHFEIDGSNVYDPINGTGISVVNSFYGYDSNGNKKLKDAFGVGGFSSDYEIHDLILKNAAVGIRAKLDPKCSKPGSYRLDKFNYTENYIHQNISFHDIFIDNVRDEAMYIGSTKWNGISCNGETIYPFSFNNVEIYNIEASNTGWDAIQLSSSPLGNNSIHDCKVTNYGTSGQTSQAHGIMIGGGTVADIYNNEVRNGSGNGIEHRGWGGGNIYNNVIEDAGSIPSLTNFHPNGIFVRAKDLNPNEITSFNISNNTIINPKELGVQLIGIEILTKNNKIYNNLIIGGCRDVTGYFNDFYLHAAKGSGGSNQAKQWLTHSYQDKILKCSYDNNISWVDISSNLFFATVGEANFMNGEDLDPTSPCVDAGKIEDANFSYSYLFDFEGDKRSENRLNNGHWYGNRIDVGAYEYQEISNERIITNVNTPNVINSKSRGEIMIRTINPIQFINVYNMAGQLVVSNTNKNTINSSNLDSGIYVVRYMDSESVNAEKILVR